MVAVAACHIGDPQDKSAFGHREAFLAVNLVGMWPDPPQDAEHLDWVRNTATSLQPFGTGGAYLNFSGDEGEGRVRAAYGAQAYEQLARIKATYDPGNLFRLNQNIKPAAA